jgi:hypothetical protein
MIALFAALAFAAPPIDGTFQPSISQAEIDARLTTAITDASMQFNWAIRGIARGRIEDQANACATLKFFNSATHTGVKCDAKNAIVRLNDNSEGAFDSEGRQVTSVVRVHLPRRRLLRPYRGRDEQPDDHADDLHHSVQPNRNSQRTAVTTHAAKGKLPAALVRPRSERLA